MSGFSLYRFFLMIFVFMVTRVADLISPDVVVFLRSILWGMLANVLRELLFHLKGLLMNVICELFVFTSFGTRAGTWTDSSHLCLI